MNQLKEKILKNGISACMVIFVILLLVHCGEAIFLRLDESIFAENFINKIFGIFILFLILHLLKWKWEDIGFKKNNIGKNIALGLALGFGAFFVAYLVEIIILSGQNQFLGIGLFTTGFSLTGDPVIHTGIGFILMCVLFNIINVIMEEGTFRGLFCKLISIDHSIKVAILFQALLFGLWHIVTPFHNFVDGDIGFVGFIGLSIGYVILAGIMGIKWGLLKKMTGSLYAGMADHFFNNCIATNLVHVMTVGGFDELMIVRIVIAQILSFMIIVLIYRKRY